MSQLSLILKKHSLEFYPVIPFDKMKDKLLPLDLSVDNKELEPGIFSQTTLFENYITGKIKSSGSAYGFGGYAENRSVYQRSALFNDEEPRTLHLGIDIWSAAGTRVSAPLGGLIHSFAFNDHFGDYGATIILQHQLDAVTFFTLYGHLSLDDIGGARVGQYISRGEVFAHFGKPEENGHWPPHLHFQVISDIAHYYGDYPGVCKMSESEKWMANSPDPSPLLNFG
jgi:murein DD-endopeptidase MepM/ murein hydrolase activator NlpD